MLDEKDILSVGKDLSKSTDAPLGHMCNEDKSPKPKIATVHESTNIFLGILCGHVQNLVAESHWANENARHRHDEWQETLKTLGEIQCKSQRTGAIVICVGICFMSTLISIVVSLLI